MMVGQNLLGQQHTQQNLKSFIHHNQMSTVSSSHADLWSVNSLFCHLCPTGSLLLSQLEPFLILWIHSSSLLPRGLSGQVE